MRPSALAALAIVAAGAALAQPIANAPALNQLCRADYERYCPPYQGHRRGLAECIRDHLGQASPGCQMAVHQRIVMLRAMEARNPRMRALLDAQIRIYGGQP
jgi:hypothetical protein